MKSLAQSSTEDMGRKGKVAIDVDPRAEEAVKRTKRPMGARRVDRSTRNGPVTTTGAAAVVAANGGRDSSAALFPTDVARRSNQMKSKSKLTRRAKPTDEKVWITKCGVLPPSCAE